MGALSGSLSGMCTPLYIFGFKPSRAVQSTIPSMQYTCIYMQRTLCKPMPIMTKTSKLLPFQKRTYLRGLQIRPFRVYLAD